MFLFINTKASEDVARKVSEDFDGYIKVVVDIERGILVAGGTLHSDGKKLLLNRGCKQENLWGGGLDLETNEIDYESMINIRSSKGNPSREVLSVDVRQKMETVIRRLLQG